MVYVYNELYIEMSVLQNPRLHSLSNIFLCLVSTFLKFSLSTVHVHGNYNIIEDSLLTCIKTYTNGF